MLTLNGEGRSGSSRVLGTVSPEQNVQRRRMFHTSWTGDESSLVSMPPSHVMSLRAPNPPTFPVDPEPEEGQVEGQLVEGQDCQVGGVLWPQAAACYPQRPHEAAADRILCPKAGWAKSENNSFRVNVRLKESRPQRVK